MTGVEWPRVSDALKILRRRRDNGFYSNRVHEFGELDVSEKVAQIVVGYAPYVDRFVWHKIPDPDVQKGRS